MRLESEWPGIQITVCIVPYCTLEQTRQSLDPCLSLEVHCIYTVSLPLQIVFPIYRIGM
jgi:hypothetical protein